MATTYVLIASNTVGSGGAASVTFSSIPQTYTDLLVKFSGKDNSSSTGGNIIYLTFNGTGTTYTDKLLFGNGSSASSGSYAGMVGEVNTSATTANTFSNAEIYIPNYTSSNQKSFSTDGVTENNATLAYATLDAGLWNGTGAITSITLNSGSTLQQYSTFYLYGIKNS